MRELKVGDYVRTYLSGTFQIVSIYEEDSLWSNIKTKKVILQRKLTAGGSLVKKGTLRHDYLNNCYLATDCITKNIERELNILKHIHESNSSNLT